MRNIDFCFEPAICAFRLLNWTVTVLCWCILLHALNMLVTIYTAWYHRQRLCVLHVKSVVMLHVSLRQQTAIVCTTLADLTTCSLFSVHVFMLRHPSSPAMAQSCSGSVHVRFRPVADSVPLWQFLSQHFFFPSVPFNQCCILRCILILLLAEGQAGEGWEPSYKAMLLGEHWAEMYTESCVTLYIHLCRYRQVICFFKTESCVSNDQAVCFTVMNRPYKQSGLEGYMVQIQIAFHALCIPVMQDLQYMTLRRPDVRAELVWTCWPSLACP